MRSNTVMRSILVSRLILAFLLLVMLGGCQLPDQAYTGKFTDLYQSVRDSARINGFLTLKKNQGPAIRLEVASIEILADDLWLPLTSGPLTIDSTEIGTGQLFLGGQTVLPGRYQRLRIKVTEGAIRQAGKVLQGQQHDRPGGLLRQFADRPGQGGYLRRAGEPRRYAQGHDLRTDLVDCRRPHREEAGVSLLPRYCRPLGR